MKRNPNIPELWSAQNIADWMKLHEKTVRRTVISRPGFPLPVAPAGEEYSERRWFSDEVIEWMRQCRASLPRARVRQPSSEATSEASLS